MSVQTAAIQRVEDLGENKRIEDKRLDHHILMLLLRGIAEMMKPKNP